VAAVHDLHIFPQLGPSCRIVKALGSFQSIPEIDPTLACWPLYEFEESGLTAAATHRLLSSWIYIPNSFGTA
jgi:hypothetical protein